MANCLIMMLKRIVLFWLVGTNRKIPLCHLTDDLVFSSMIRRCRFWRRPQIRWAHTRPLTCNPRRLPYEPAGEFIQTQFMNEGGGNAKGTLCKGEITTAKSFLSFSLSFRVCLHTLPCSLVLFLTQPDWWKDSIGREKETMETRSWCTLNGKTLKKEDIHSVELPYTEGSSLLHYFECYKSFLHAWLQKTRGGLTTSTYYVRMTVAKDVLTCWHASP